MVNIRTTLLAGSCLVLVGIGATTLVARSKTTASVVAPAPVPPCAGSISGFRPAAFCPPAGWQGHRFVLSQNYPTTAPTDARPWLAFDPVTQPDQYIGAVLAYFYDGNLRMPVDISFEPTLNTKRMWYNAPWQDFGMNGREPIHGLTRERVSQPFELDPAQKSNWNNYAVGFYNAPGAVTIGQIWGNHAKPNITAAVRMPEGTVAAKLLFTTAAVSEVPYLAGSPEWDAYVFANSNDPRPTPTSPRAAMKVRLLQIDIAVKDSRLASKTGWVFGTFVYGGGPKKPGQQPTGQGWINVAPVGLMWGNDPSYPGTGPLKETWLNPAVAMPHVGYQGRLNGPVDNKVSSCLSCHSTAELPPGAMIPSGNPARWFQNIPSGTPFDAGRASTDYSLQISLGLANFQATQALVAAKTPQAKALAKQRVEALENTPPRDGGAVH